MAFIASMPRQTSGASHPPASPVPDSRSREAAAEFEGLLFAQALAPMAKTCGFLGDSVVNLVATGIARHDAGGLGATLVRAIDAARQDAVDHR